MIQLSWLNIFLGSISFVRNSQYFSLSSPWQFGEANLTYSKYTYHSMHPQICMLDHGPSCLFFFNTIIILLLHATKICFRSLGSKHHTRDLNSKSLPWWCFDIFWIRDFTRNITISKKWQDTIFWKNAFMFEWVLLANLLWRKEVAYLEMYWKTRNYSEMKFLHQKLIFLTHPGKPSLSFSKRIYSCILPDILGTQIWIIPTIIVSLSLHLSYRISLILLSLRGIRSILGQTIMFIWVDTAFS